MKEANTKISCDADQFGNVIVTRSKKNAVLSIDFLNASISGDEIYFFRRMYVLKISLK